MFLGAIAISWFLTIGYVPMQDACLYGQMESLPSNKVATVAELGLRARLDRVTVYGAIENYQFVGVADRAGYFMPYRADYKIGLSIRIADGVELFVEHECDHPVLYNSTCVPSSTFIMDETRIAIKFSGGDL